LLILTSNGLSGQTILQKLKGMITADMKKAALIPTASEFHDEKEKNIARHTKILNELNLEVSIIDLAKEHSSSLNNYDVIYLMGGNPCYLLDVMRKNNCKEYFETFVKEKIVIGSSSGSLVFQNTIDYIVELYPELNEIHRLDNFDGLGLTDKLIYPHTASLSENAVSFLDNYEKRTNHKINYLEDGQGLLLYADECVIA